MNAPITNLRRYISGPWNRSESDQNTLSREEAGHLEASASARMVDVYRQHHRTMLWISLAVIAASFFLRRTGSESVRLVWSHIELPPLCASRMFFGVECPGCGLTRSFVALANGDLLASWQ